MPVELIDELDRFNILGSFFELKNNIISKYNVAKNNNPRINGLHPSPPTITVATSLPAGQSTAYTLSSNQDVFVHSGGQLITSGSLGGRTRSAIIATTGGNIGDGAGGQASFARIEFLADSSKITIRVTRSAAPYRFIVDGKYITLEGTLTTLSTPTSTSEYISLDFSSAGGRKIRSVILETQQDNGFVAVYVGPTEKVFKSNVSDLVRASFLGDSYVYGSGATVLGDGLGAVLADQLGIRFIQNSGSGGTGWATSNSAYRFDERIFNGDLELGGTPDIIFLMASYNDRNNTPSIITSNALFGMQTARTKYPNAIIIVLGCFPGATGPSAGILSAEDAVLSAFNSFLDPKSAFIPVSNDTNGAWITGTGKVGAVTNSGNSDVMTDTDGVHPSNSPGHYYIGTRIAISTIEAINSMDVTLSS